ncbi:MAG: hypothetical protein CM15mP109_16010 [Candidatus Dadabacteria bacterium]|nr:MAG: hypothetical protein CM15mP109_16010 [Candidatus Dadabacteria bacterium]
MFKYLKQLTSLVAMVAVLFTFTTESMAAKNLKHKNTQRRVCKMWSISRSSRVF